MPDLPIGPTGSEISLKEFDYVQKSTKSFNSDIQAELDNSAFIIIIYNFSTTLNYLIVIIIVSGLQGEIKM